MNLDLISYLSSHLSSKLLVSTSGHGAAGFDEVAVQSDDSIALSSVRYSGRLKTTTNKTTFFN